MEYFLIIVVTCITLGSQLLLKKAIGAIGPLAEISAFKFLFAALTSPYVLTAIALQGIGFMLWFFVLSKVKLGVAFAISGAFFYVLIAISTWIFFGEKLTLTQWIGLVLISCGVILLSCFQS
ncbi:hypothetical protein PKF023_03320 [Polynucleobacter yangtzensis]|uniref:EamA domain-containing protein n=1 Tax=Polynucleobacter yangtzensis TaxID=1743159 RepID=A0A9C7CHP6_9BURK|nr:SMR family transporter [Polynucleobacter yangtzensis]BDT76529.1 hypothetical protein PKF023_03320 [Polynucleobacter yangtzensis]